MTATRKPKYVPPSVKALTAQEAAPLVFAECKRLSAVLAAQWTPQEQVEALASECRRQREQIQALRKALDSRYTDALRKALDSRYTDALHAERPFSGFDRRNGASPRRAEGVAVNRGPRAKTANRQWIMFTLECPECNSALASPKGSLNWCVFEDNKEPVSCFECGTVCKVPA